MEALGTNSPTSDSKNVEYIESGTMGLDVIGRGLQFKKNDDFVAAFGVELENPESVIRYQVLKTTFDSLNRSYFGLNDFSGDSDEGCFNIIPVSGGAIGLTFLGGLHVVQTTLITKIITQQVESPKVFRENFVQRMIAYLNQFSQVDYLNEETRNSVRSYLEHWLNVDDYHRYLSALLNIMQEDELTLDSKIEILKALPEINDIKTKKYRTYILRAMLKSEISVLRSVSVEGLSKILDYDSMSDLISAFDIEKNKGIKSLMRGILAKLDAVKPSRQLSNFEILDMVKIIQARNKKQRLELLENEKSSELSSDEK